VIAVALGGSYFAVSRSAVRRLIRRAMGDTPDLLARAVTRGNEGLFTCGNWGWWGI